MAARAEKVRRHKNVFDSTVTGKLGVRLYESLSCYSTARKRLKSKAFAFETLWQAMQLVGRLKGKRVLKIAPDDAFLSYLREVEGADVIPYYGNVQNIGKNLKPGNFEIAFANRVFEPDAFKYSAGVYRNQVREAVERTEILKQLASKLSKGGYIIATGSTSKVIFKPREAKEAGFKIIKMNAPGVTYNLTTSSGGRVTILQKL